MGGGAAALTANPSPLLHFRPFFGVIVRVLSTYLAGPLLVIKKAKWISVEQGHCTLAVVKRYWSVPRML